MSFRLSRLGVGERLIGIGSILLLVDLFAVPWFSYEPAYHAIAVMLRQRVSANGWQSFEVIGPLSVVVCAAGIAIGWMTARRRSPAVPIVVTIFLTPVSFALALVLAIRVLLDRPSVHLVQAGGANVIATRPGAYVGLALSVAICVGTCLSLRREGVDTEDSPAVIETLSVEQSPTSSHA